MNGWVSPAVANYECFSFEKFKGFQKKMVSFFLPLDPFFVKVVSCCCALDNSCLCCIGLTHWATRATAAAAAACRCIPTTSPGLVIRRNATTRRYPRKKIFFYFDWCCCSHFFEPKQPFNLGLGFGFGWDLDRNWKLGSSLFRVLWGFWFRCSI